jgi:hypothetical protein
MTVIDEEKFYGSVDRIVNKLRTQADVVAVSKEHQLLFTDTGNSILLQSDNKFTRKTSYLSLMVFMEIYGTIPISTDRGTSDWGYYIRHTNEI